MSRTYKDKKYDLRFPEEKWDYDIAIPEGGYSWARCLELPGVKTKKSRKRYEGFHKWYQATPGWWITMYMQSPMRAKCRNWEKQVINSDDLEAEICPDFGHRPHKYFW